MSTPREILANNAGPMSCSVCGRSRPAGFVTCGGSFCQEASFHRNAERVARRGSRARADAAARAATAEDAARRWAAR